MVETEHLDHPAVEVTLPVDREHHQYEVPQHTTLFFWTTLAAGTPERLPQIQSPLGSCLFNEICNSREQMTWSVSINGESVPLLTDSYYRCDGYTGFAWWIALGSVELPATVCVEFETSGTQPTVQEHPLVLWTDQGEMLQWGTTTESTVDLIPSNSPPSTFPTRQEQLWERLTVYKPRDDIE